LPVGPLPTTPLPPADIGTTPALPTSGPSLPTSAPVDQMLPPGAGVTGPIVGPGAQVALPTQQAAARAATMQNQRIEPGEDEILIPTEDGQTIVRHRPKTVFNGEEDVELRELTSEEKVKKRTKKNLLVWSFCVLVLFAVVAILLYYGPL
jgi:hypothetical protein